MMGNYISPKNMEELCKALGEKDEDTYIIAGGTDLIIKFEKEQIFDYKIIDIDKYGEFRDISSNDEIIDIGACVTMTELEEDEEIKRYIPALALAARSVGSTQIRNRATIGGNVANAAQCGDTIPVLFAYDADIQILNSNGEYRYEKVRNFVTGIGKTNLKSDELITNIIIKKSNHISSFSKIGSRKTVTISKLNCCGKFQMTGDIIDEVEIYMGAVGVKPIRADIIEESLRGKKLENIKDVDFSSAVQLQIERAIPDRSSKHYKKRAGVGLIEDIIYGLRN